MSKLLDLLLNFLKGLFYFLFKHIRDVAMELNQAKDGIPTRYLFADILTVLLSCGMFLLLNLLALLVFTLLPQGKDVLLIIAEEVGVQHTFFRNLLWLLGGVFIWSVVTEYGCRYAIYVTDNSAKSLSAERVKWRRVVQKTVAQLFLSLPYLIVLIGLIINYVNDSAMTVSQRNLGFGLPAVCLFLIFNWVARFYFNDTIRQQLHEHPSSFLRFMVLPKRELEWCSKLFGIYDEYVFTIRKPSNFTNKISGPVEIFSENFMGLPDKERNRFPQQTDKIAPGTVVPSEFRFKQFDEEKDKPDGLYKWSYEIPLNFYAHLHRQLKAIVLLSAIVFLIFCCLPVKAYQMIGAPGLVIMAFTCWSGIYLGILYADYAWLRKAKVSLRFLLLVVLILCSVMNEDHPVRINTNNNEDHRPELTAHFDQWFRQHISDTSHHQYRFKWIDTARDQVPDSAYPVLFVCAEGGALRTGAFTSQLLSYMQDELIRSPARIDFKKYIYAYSGVSGGSLGVGFFNAMAYLTPPATLKKDSLSQLTGDFFSRDFLAPVIGKMFYGDLLNLFFPYQIGRFDRAIALEESWERGFTETITSKGFNVFSGDFLKFYPAHHTYPAMFINTTEVESGLQCWLSNVRPDSGMTLFRERDLFDYKLRGNINYSTMINFSSRFPLFSPGAMLKENEERKYHYVDGGYVENTGAGTMKEVLQALSQRSVHFQRGEIIPFVLVLKFSDDKDTEYANVNFGNELTEVVTAIYNTRAGRSHTALIELDTLVQRLHGKMSTLSVGEPGSKVPLNWVLSGSSLHNLKNDISKKWQFRKVNDLKKLFLIDSANCVMCKRP